MFEYFEFFMRDGIKWFWMWIIISFLFELYGFCRGLDLLKWKELFDMYGVLVDLLKFIVYFESEGFFNVVIIDCILSV